MLGHTEDLFPSMCRKAKLLDRNRPHHSDYQPMESQLTNNSTLISQLDSELERDSINKCAQLAKERGEMERELESYRADRCLGRNERQSNKRESPQQDVPKSEEEPVWKPQDVTMRQKHRYSGQTSRVSDYRRACYFGTTSSPMDRLPKCHIQWDISPVTSVTSLVPVQSPWETKSRRSQHPRTCRETTENSFAVELSSSSVTQNISFPTLSPYISSESPTPILCVPTPDKARSLISKKETDTCMKSLTEQGFRENRQDGDVDSRARHQYASHGTQPWDPATRGPAADIEELESSVSYVLPERTAGVNYTAKRDPSPSCFSTLPCEHHEIGEKAEEKETQTKDDCRSLGFYSELEREGVRTRSRMSDKCVFSDSPSPISELTLVEEVESDQSQLSVSGMSGFFKAKPTSPSPKMSQLQTSAILEYLSLPGFIEMSVDEPVVDAEVTKTAGQNSELKSKKSPGTRPDVVPKNWEVHLQENPDTGLNQKAHFKHDHSTYAAESSAHASAKGYKHSLQGEGRDSSPRVRFPEETRPSSPLPEKTSKQLYNEKKQICAGTKNTDRPEATLDVSRSRSAHTLFSAAKGMAEIVSKHSQSFVDSSESLSEQSQRQASQGSRTNNIASRICQAPVPLLKKSLSLGPCRTLSGMGQPRLFLKKSISLGSRRWEHFESPRAYISEKCYWDEFPNPDDRSYSFGRSQSSSPRPGPSWREYIPFRRPSMGSLERPHHVHSPSYLNPSVYPPRQTSVSPMLEPADPQRQAAVFPKSTRWSPSYQDMLRSAQHKYVPMPSSIPVPLYQHWPGSKGGSMRPMDPRRGPPRSYLPRGISWPSPYYTSVPPIDIETYRQPDRMIGRGGEIEMREGKEIREGGRASYASQSSGRGSAGLFRQSLSITPTLLSSPETTEESERHRAEMELPGRRAKR